MPLEIFVDEVPRERTVWEAIVGEPVMREAMRAVRVRKPRPGLVWSIPSALDVPRLMASYEACLKEVGRPRGFANKEGIEGPYRSISLVHNPDHQDGLIRSSRRLGTPQNGVREFNCCSADEQPQRKNSYWDTLGFRAVHPTIERHFGWFIETFGGTLVRSRIATLVHSEFERIAEPEFNWHIDESPFCNLRMNIPLVTAPQYLMEIDSEHVPAGYNSRQPMDATCAGADTGRLAAAATRGTPSCRTASSPSRRRRSIACTSCSASVRGSTGTRSGGAGAPTRTSASTILTTCSTACFAERQREPAESQSLPSDGSIRRASRHDAAAIEALRLACYRRAREFVLLQPACLAWDEIDDASVVYKLCDGQGEILATVRSTWVPSADALERRMGCECRLPPSCFPTLFLSRGATVSRAASGRGLHSLMRSATSPRPRGSARRLHRRGLTSMRRICAGSGCSGFSLRTPSRRLRPGGARRPPMLVACLPAAHSHGAPIAHQLVATRSGVSDRLRRRGCARTVHRGPWLQGVTP